MNLQHSTINYIKVYRIPMASKNNRKPQKASKKSANAPHQEEAKSPAEPVNRRVGIPIVGMGASAGGLKAIESFFKAMPPEPGMAFVVVTHLHPEHESHMAELIQNHTAMPATQVTKKVKVEINHVYVIPPNRSIVLTDSHLDVIEFDQPHGQRTPIDHFFRSMASDKRESVAIIFSGGGTDGSVGIKDVKELGGLLMVQHPDDAEYDSMPRAAISTGLADVVLPANQLPEKLVDYIRHQPQLPHDPNQLNEQEVETLQRILAQVHARTGHDFNQYKRTTILRRVERRMQLNGFTTLDSYLNFLRNNAGEAQSMFNDILIGVTNFFRDRDSWAALDEKVIPELFKNKGQNDTIRVWTMGCATGEEAYGIAILLFEQAARLDVRPYIQVFASDLDERSVTHAREGLYPTAIEADVSPERLDRFFNREGEYYRIKREIRDSVLFTSHNVLRDPPFSRQDLISCRNVLIYLQREVQEKVFEIFHYALNPGSYLFLGSSESAEHLPDLYNVLDKPHRIYVTRPRHGNRSHIPSMPLMQRLAPHTAEPYIPSSRPNLGRYFENAPAIEELHQKSLESYGPPSILINERYSIIHVSETAGRYLMQPKGPITGDLLKLVRAELQLELRTALFRAFEKDETTISRLIAVQFNGHARRVVISVRPQTENLGADKAVERQALVLFLEDDLEDAVELKPAEDAQARNHLGHNKRAGQLEVEVQRLREQLQVTVEEYDSSNEEMKAANEELQSINEEYRSATEELETSKEELQSVNEELQTVNSEMKSKLEETSRAHKELENLMGATEIATLFLDRELRIQRYTAGVKQLFNIRAGDRGRRISDLTHKLSYNEFSEDAEQVLRTLALVEREVRLENGESYLLRLRPYRTVDDRIEGVVISFIDITKRREVEQLLLTLNETLEDRIEARTGEIAYINAQLGLARDLFQALFNANPLPTALSRLDDAMFIDVNEAYLTYFGLKRDEVINHFAPELKLPFEPKIREGLIAKLQKDGLIQDLELVIEHPSNGSRTILMSLRTLKIGEINTVILAFTDITDRVRAEQQIRSLASELSDAEQHERARLSQVLHDDLQQRIFAVKMQVALLRDAYKKDNTTPVDFAQVSEWLDESIAITRNLSMDLSPAVLQGDSLTDALMWLSSQMENQYGLKVNIEPNKVDTHFEDTLRILLFQAVRESLFNIVKHADILEAFVIVEKVKDFIRLTIKDHGKGFDPDISKNSGGLINLKQRLVLMGCDLQLKSKPGEGTQVVIDVFSK